MNKLIIFILCLLFIQHTFAQDFGQHPIQDWKKIESAVCNVIFPAGLEQQASRIADIVNYQRENTNASVGPLAKKINIVLHNQSIIPNGNVQLGPFRSNFLTTAPQNPNALGSLDWLDILSVHEYRHVQQISNGKVGFTKILSALLGEEAWLVTLFVSVPEWYFEGDAVVAETAYSDAGRGRMPAFTAQQRAMGLANINYNYQVARNRSYLLNVPNQYPLGFMMLSHLKNTKGTNITTPILKDGASYKGLFYSFSKAMKKHAGLHTNELYKESWKNAKTLWQRQRDLAGIRPTISVTKKPKRINTSYFFPKFDSEENILAIKSSYSEIPKLVKIIGDKETKLSSMGMQIGDIHYNHCGDFLTWTEGTFNARRNNVSFSDVYLFDLKTSTKKRLTKKGKFFSPTVDEQGNVYAIQIGLDLINSLVKINAVTKEIDTIKKFPKGVALSRLAYNEPANVIVLQKKVNSKISLAKITLTDNQETNLVNPTAHILADPFIFRDYVYYSASFSGIDNIYKSPLNGAGNIEQLTSVPIGAYQPNLDSNGKILLFTEHTELGKVISKIDLTDDMNAPIAWDNLLEPKEMEWQDKVAAKEEGGNLLVKVPSKKYEVKKYKGISGLRLYSWLPSLSSEETGIDFSFGNHLQDFEISALTAYNFNEDTPVNRLSLSYAKWYPVLNLNTSFFTRSLAHQNPEGGELSKLDYNELKISPEISLPHNGIKGNYFTQFTPSLAFNHHRTSNRFLDETKVDNENYNSLTGTLSLYALKRTAIQNIAPKFGFSSFITFNQNLDNDKDQKLFMRGRIYLPGIGKNHSLRITGAYQKEEIKNTFKDIDNFIYPRGYAIPVNQEVQNYSLDYSFPLAYPHIGIAGITYFKRIRANLFYDYGESILSLNNQVVNFQSTGVELIFDNTLLNLAGLEIGLGFRGTYLIEEDPLLNTGKTFKFDFFFASDL